MTLTEGIFWGLSVLALSSALGVVLSKNPVHSVLWLIVTFFALSGHYILLNAQFIGIVNLIVYAGAIMVLFLFVIMLMNLNASTEIQKHWWLRLAGVVSGGSLMIVLLASLRHLEIKGKLAQLKEGDIGLIHQIGRAHV